MLLRSNDHNLAVPRANYQAFGDRTFAHSGPFLWNNLPCEIYHKVQLWLFLNQS